MTILIGFIMLLVTLLGAALTTLTLPGIWFIVLAAILCQWWQDGGLYSWWTIGAAATLGLVAEVLEVAASAAGASAAGGTRRGAIGSIAGALLGAIAGSFVFPVVGTIVGGAVGAGLGAIACERHAGAMTWTGSARVGAGAATGRLVATLLKVGFAIVIGIILTTAAFIP
ncbi:MAG: DUF456 domain-containing protein [Phycisphaeraceae bacterium]|nr:DUF456 domain-containing protein [Phycisphaeraceae bacterium]